MRRQAIALMALALPGCIIIQDGWYGDDGHHHCDGYDCDDGCGDDDNDGVSNCDEDPYGEEVCDGLDNDGDGLVDEDAVDAPTWYVDHDGDGHGDPGSAIRACDPPPGATASGDDCDDADACVHPGADEGCVAFDLDCDGLTYENDACAGLCPLDEKDCVPLSEALDQGTACVISDETGLGIDVRNYGDNDLCVDQPTFHSSNNTQSAFLDNGNLQIRVLSGGEAKFGYGSMTTQNGVDQTYIGLPAWWCVESGQAVTPASAFDWYGEEAPDVLLDQVDPAWDRDHDGVSDTSDWEGDGGVLAQYALWDWQDTHSALTVGKRARVEDGQVVVDLVARNIGVDGGAGVVTDVVPAGWALVSASPAPDQIAEDDLGNTLIVWGVSVSGVVVPSDPQQTTGISAETLSYRFARTSSEDAARLDLDPATVEYHDGERWEISLSVATAALGYDGNGDGTVECF